MAKHRKPPEPIQQEPAALPKPTAAPAAPMPEVTAKQIADPWWEVSAGNLPKLELQAPTEEVAKWFYKQRMRINRPEPTAKRVA